MAKTKNAGTDWLRIERQIRQELRDVLADGTSADAAVNAAMARGALHRIDLILGDGTGRGYELEGKAPAEWTDVGNHLTVAPVQLVDMKTDKA